MIGYLCRRTSSNQRREMDEKEILTYNEGIFLIPG